MKFLIAMVCIFCMSLSQGVLADAKTGQSTYAAKGCIGCHGAGGKSVVSTYPSLAGRDKAFVKKSLTDFRSGARQEPTMNAMAAGLNDADIENISDYIGSL